jgi:P27 family predicted phage terminase small subunit
MRGRKPTPTVLKKLHGNPGDRPLNIREPIPEGDLITPPDYLTAEQRENWAYALRYAPPGLLRKIDRAQLVAFVVAEDLYRQAVAMQARAPSLLMRVGPPPAAGEPDNRPLQQSPMLAIINKQAIIMNKIAAELGFTPASRARVQVQPGAFVPGSAAAAKTIDLEDYLAAAPRPQMH